MAEFKKCEIVIWSKDTNFQTIDGTQIYKR